MIYIGVSIIVLLAVMGAYILYAAYAKSKDVMSFKQSMELCDLPIVTFYIGEKKLNFVLDLIKFFCLVVSSDFFFS